MFKMQIGKRNIFVGAYTSSGTFVANAEHICQAAASAFKFTLPSRLANGFVIDGEFFSKNWNDTNSAVMTEVYDFDLSKGLRLNAFDILPIDDWRKHKCAIPLSIRKQLLKQVVEVNIDSKLVKMLKYVPVDNLRPDQVTSMMLERTKKGFEGMMIKPVDGLYMFKKSKDWLKVKPFQSADLKIIGAELGTEGKQHADKLGNLVVQGKVDGKKIKTSVGGGFTVKQRKELWAMHQKGKLVGKIAEVIYDCITVDHALRFPRFYRLREDK